MKGRVLVLFIGDDWAEDHHDVEVVQDEAGGKLATARLPEGIEGIAKLHAIVARHGGEDLEPGQVVVGIETDRGPWVQALIAASYLVYAVNPRQAARFKERYGTSGAKSDRGDAHALADMVRIDRDQLRPIAGDSGGPKPFAWLPAHQTLIWERTRTFQRLRSTLREYFPGALAAYAGLELTSTDAMELLIKAPTPDEAARLTKPQITAVLARHRRRSRDQKAGAGRPRCVSPSSACPRRSPLPTAQQRSRTPEC